MSGERIQNRRVDTPSGATKTTVGAKDLMKFQRWEIAALLDLYEEELDSFYRGE